jgi:hypothetical protein
LVTRTGLWGVTERATSQKRRPSCNDSMKKQSTPLSGSSPKYSSTSLSAISDLLPAA